jgi:hypothetical protein
MSYRVRHAEIHQEEDAVPWAKVLAFVGAVLVISAVLVVWALSMINASTRALRPSGVFDERSLGPRHMVARVREDLFDERGETTLDAAARRELGSFGWVDRDAGVVRIPIERAMDEVAREQGR